MFQTIQRRWSRSFRKRYERLGVAIFSASSTWRREPSIEAPLVELAMRGFSIHRSRTEWDIRSNPDPAIQQMLGNHSDVMLSKSEASALA